MVRCLISSKQCSAISMTTITNYIVYDVMTATSKKIDKLIGTKGFVLQLAIKDNN